MISEVEAVGPSSSEDLAVAGSPPWELERYADMRAELIRRAERLQRVFALQRREPADFERFVQAERALCRGVDEFDWGALVYWINEYAWVRAEKCPDPLLKNAPFVLWESQQEVCRRLCDFLRRRGDTGAFLVPKSRELGVTWIILLWVQWLWQFHGSSSLLGSKNEDQVDRKADMGTLFERLRFQLDRQPFFLVPRHSTAFCIIARLDGVPASITGAATTDKFGRGPRYRVIVVDEYAAIDAGTADGMLTSTESAGPLVLIYNPQGEDHPSFRLYQNLPREDVLELPWTADPYRPYDPGLEVNNRHQPFLAHVFRTGKLSWHQIETQYCCSHAPAAEGLIFDYDSIVEFDESTPEWAPVAEMARMTWTHLGGWDFGSGTSLLVCLFGLIFFEVGDSAPFVLWIDDERIWERTPWFTAAEEALEVMAPYRGMRWHLGDPAGKQTQADQQSWESHLCGAGVPLHCLDAAYNAFESQEWLIRNVQHMLNAGRLRIHRKKCPHLIQALKSWRRRLREGVEVTHAAGRVPPLKDWPSHACQALLYLAAGVAIVQHSIQRERDASKAPIPQTGGPGSQEATIRLLEAFQAGRPLEYNAR